MRRRNLLSEADRALWRHATRLDVPLAGRALRDRDPPAPPSSASAREPDPHPDPAKQVNARPARLPTELPRSPLKVEASRRPTSPPGLDRATARRLGRGAISIDLRLDLHGCTQQEARDRLDRFISRAWKDGQRRLLVITGKGSTSRAGDEWGCAGGVLRRNVPRWLNETPNRDRVLAWTEAQPRHGGSGAIYVLLRRSTLR